MATFLAPAVVAAGALIRLRRSYEAERRLRVELEHMSRATAAVAEAVADVSAADISAVLTMIALQAQSLTRAEYVALGICGAEPGQPFHPWVFEGMTDDVARAIGRHPRPVGTLGRVARDGRVVRSPDVRAHPDFAGLPSGHPEMASFLGVPVRYRGKPVGNLYLANRPGGAEFSDSDEHVVRMLAARVGAAIEIATHYAGATREHAWLQSVVDQMPDAVVVYDERGRVHAANQASVPLSCADADRRDPFGNCVMLDLRELDGSALAAGRWPTVRVLRGREGIVREEMLARLSTGKLCPVAVSAAPVLSAAGEITGAMLIVQDVSEHKELERLREQ